MVSEDNLIPKFAVMIQTPRNEIFAILAGVSYGSFPRQARVLPSSRFAFYVGHSGCIDYARFRSWPHPSLLFVGQVWGLWKRNSYLRMSLR